MKPVRHSWRKERERLAWPWCHLHPPHPRRPTHRAHEALGVPDTLQGRQVIVRDGALTALAFGGKHGQEVLVAVRLPLVLQEPCGDGIGVGTQPGMAHTDTGVPRTGESTGSCWDVVRGARAGDTCDGGRTPTPAPWDIPSSPNTFPQWAQKKCSGCQVCSRAVRTFCRKSRGEEGAGAGRGGRGRGSLPHLADGAGTVGTARGESLVIILLTERLPTLLEERPLVQLLPAAGTGEVLGVPGFAQGCEHL